MKQPLMLQSSCVDCKHYDGFGQCYEHGNNLIENCIDYRKDKVMKTNEAPEKIYCTLTEDGFYLTTIKPEPPFAKGVEYIQTDAFIEKAKEFLSKESNIPLWEDRGGSFGCDTPKLVEHFIKYMKGK